MTKISTTPPCEGDNTHTAEKEGLRQDLQAILGQLFDVHVQGVEAHAHFVGTRFAGFQRQLEATVQTAREASNAIADVLRRFDSDVARGLILTEVPPAIPGLRPGERCTTAAARMINSRIALVISTIRCFHNQQRDADTSTVTLLGAIARAVDKHALMLASESLDINSSAWSEK